MIASSCLWRLQAEGPLDALGEAYERLSAAEDSAALTLSLFERPGGRASLEALFETAPDAEAFLAGGGLEAGALDDVHVSPLPEEDWVAMSLAGLPPVTAGRFFLHGGHHGAAPADAIPILIEANQAFGTGHHATTKGCLIAFGALLDGGAGFANVLDLGCGAGTLAIAAAKTLPGAAILATDNDPVAIEVTDENLIANAAAGRIATAVAEGMASGAIADRAPYDLIFANILAAPLIALAEDVAAAVAPGGRLILSGLLTEQRDAVLAAYAGAGLTLESELALDGWSTLVLGAGAP